MSYEWIHLINLKRRILFSFFLISNLDAKRERLRFSPWSVFCPNVDYTLPMGRESLISEMSPILSHLRREMKGRLVRKGGRVSKEKKEFAMAEERIERETNK